MTDKKERELAVSDDALLHPVPVTRDMACRARQSNEMCGQKVEQGMGDQGKPQRRTNNCRSGSEQQLQQLQIWARTDKLSGRAEEAVQDKSIPGPGHEQDNARTLLRDVVSHSL